MERLPHGLFGTVLIVAGDSVVDVLVLAEGQTVPGPVELGGCSLVSTAEVTGRPSWGGSVKQLEKFLQRRMGDSNPRGLSPNTLSKRAP